jgi:NTP pyrophosphatase (non-canonical NTP hydrolase)
MLIHRSQERKRKFGEILANVSEVITEVGQHSSDAILLIAKEKQSANKEREEKVENIRTKFPFLAVELGELLTAVRGKGDDCTAMDALCHTIISVIDETEKIIEIFSKVATVLPSSFDTRKMTDVVEGALDPSSSTIDKNVGSQDDTSNVCHGQPRDGSMHGEGDEETQMHVGNDPDDVAKLYSGMEATKQKAMRLQPKIDEYVQLFLMAIEATITEFSGKYDLDIRDLVRTMVKEDFGNWENRDSMQELRTQMTTVVGMASRVPLLQDQVKSMITLCGNWVNAEESQFSQSLD